MVRCSFGAKNCRLFWCVLEPLRNSIAVYYSFLHREWRTVTNMFTPWCFVLTLPVSEDPWVVFVRWSCGTPVTPVGVLSHPTRPVHGRGCHSWAIGGQAFLEPNGASCMLGLPPQSFKLPPRLPASAVTIFKRRCAAMLEGQSCRSGFWCYPFVSDL